MENKTITELAQEFEREHRKEWNDKSKSLVRSSRDRVDLLCSGCGASYEQHGFSYEDYKYMVSWSGGDMSYGGYLHYMEQQKDRQSS